MKIKIELEYDVDGETPDHQDVIDILHERICVGVLTSEEVGKPDKWALTQKSNSFFISPNARGEPDGGSPKA